MADKLFVDQLRELRLASPDRDLKRANDMADRYVANVLKAMKEQMLVDAEHGSSQSYKMFDQAITLAGIVPALTIYRRVVDALIVDGIESKWELVKDDHSRQTRVCFKAWGW